VVNVGYADIEKGDFGDADQRRRAGPGPATRRCEVMDGESGNRCAFTADPPSSSPIERGNVNEVMACLGRQ